MPEQLSPHQQQVTSSTTTPGAMPPNSRSPRMGHGSLNPKETPRVPTRGKLSHGNPRHDPSMRADPSPEVTDTSSRCPGSRTHPLRISEPRDSRPKSPHKTTKQQRDVGGDLEGESWCPQTPHRSGQSPQSQRHLLVHCCHAGVLASQQGPWPEPMSVSFE